jgi:hypothetical protein
VRSIAVLFVIPGLIAAIVYGLYAPVVIMEQHGVRGTLRRSRTLSRRALGTVLVITLVQFALPVLIWRAAVGTDFTLQFHDDYSPKQFGFNFSMSGGSALYQLLNLFVTPLTAIMASLLYLKTRKAGGESLRDASDQFEALDIPRSEWQARMKAAGPPRVPLTQATKKPKNNSEMEWLVFPYTCRGSDK